MVEDQQPYLGTAQKQVRFLFVRARGGLAEEAWSRVTFFTLKTLDSKAQPVAVGRRPRRTLGTDFPTRFFRKSCDKRQIDAICRADSCSKNFAQSRGDRRDVYAAAIAAHTDPRLWHLTLSA